MQANLWESQIADYLQELSSVQDELFGILGKKRECLAKVDATGLAALAPQETQIAERLQTCIRRREEMLDQARRDGMEVGNLRGVLNSIGSGRLEALPQRYSEIQRKTKLLQHQSLTNWLVIQKTLLHISQVLEIIATGGRLQPTYGNNENSNSNGSLVDRAA